MWTRQHMGVIAVSDLGDKLDAAIAEAGRRKAEQAADRERGQSEAEDQREAAGRIVEEIVVPALQELVDEAKKRDHFASVSVPDKAQSTRTSTVVEFLYWPGEAPAGQGYRYELDYFVSGDGTMRVREEVHTARGMSRLGDWPGPEDGPATKERVQELALHMMTRAIEVEIR